MSLYGEETDAFERAAKIFGVRIKRGVYGELVTAKSRLAWTFFHMGWTAARTYEANKRARKQAPRLTR